MSSSEKRARESEESKVPLPSKADFSGSFRVLDHDWIGFDMDHTISMLLLPYLLDSIGGWRKVG